MRRPRFLIEEWLPAAAIGVECIRERSKGQQPPLTASCAAVAFGPPRSSPPRSSSTIAWGGSKFIRRPLCPPDRMLDQLQRLAEEIIPAFHRR